MNSDEIFIVNPLNESGMLNRTETSDQCLTQTKAKRKFVEILEDVRIPPSTNSSSMLEQLINSSSHTNSNQTIAQLHGRNILLDFEEEPFVANNHIVHDHTYFDEISPIGEISSITEIEMYLQSDGEQSPERFQEIINVRASPVLEKANDLCEICWQYFPGEGSLIHHRRVHLAEFPIHCEQCFEYFFKSTDKDLHQQNCQKLRYECYRCRKTLYCYEDLKHHMEKY